MKKFDVLLVLWEDISEAPGWHPYGPSFPVESIVGPAQCFEVGFRIKETKRHLYLSKLVGIDIDGGPQIGGPTVIPKGCIKRVTKLKTVYAKDFP